MNIITLFAGKLDEYNKKCDKLHSTLKQKILLEWLMSIYLEMQS